MIPNDSPHPQPALQPQSLVAGGEVSDSLSLADLQTLALSALARALQSDDERIALRAAQIVVNALYRNLPPVVSEKVKVLTIQYGDDPNDPPPPWANQGYRTPGALQSGSLRAALGQDGSREDGGD